MASHALPSLSQSPWFWVHIFAIFCLAMLMINGNKVVALRTQRAQNAQMRAMASGKPVSADLPNARQERRGVAIGYWFFGAVAMVSWWQVWRLVLHPRLKTVLGNETGKTSKHSDQNSFTKGNR